MRTNIIIAILVNVGILGHIAAWRSRPASAACGNDFPVFYAGAKLLGTPQLYSPAAVQAIVQREVGCTGPAAAFIRLPFFAAMVWPLTLFPLAVAFALWRIALLAAEAGFIASFGRHWKWALLACVWSYPLAWDFDNGQDASFLLFWMAAAALLMSRKRDFTAGVCLALCATKYHLLILLPLLLIARKLWGVAAGLAAGGAVLLGVSFAVAGGNWPAQYIPAVLNPDIDPFPMEQNLRGIAQGHLPVELSLGVTVAIAVYIICRRAPIPLGLGSVAAGGVLVSHHMTMSDWAVPLFPCLILAIGCTSRVIRICAVALISPLIVVLWRIPVTDHLPELVLLGVLYALAWYVTRTKDVLTSRAVGSIV